MTLWDTAGEKNWTRPGWQSGHSTNGELSLDANNAWIFCV
jgi:hypothetical protein